MLRLRSHVRGREFAPKPVSLPGGRIGVETAFTKLTGRSPILLAGMTPTTVDAKIVAAAANAGHWAELAGGGQVTEDIFEDRVAELKMLLEPGRAVQFNSLFLDPYLWKLQLGGKRLVQRARAAGAPIDGVVVTAGIPELEEAVALIEELSEAGISNIAFKPGTVAQIRSVIRIANEVPNYPVIVHIEGGRAGGHHSWEDLDDLLLDTYAELRYAPEPGHLRRRRYRNTRAGSRLPHRSLVCRARLPGDARSTASWSAPQPWRLSKPPPLPRSSSSSSTRPELRTGSVPVPPKAEWPLAVASSVPTFTRSTTRLRVRGRLLDEVAGDAEAVAERRDEIIAALDVTAKPYFGDVDDHDVRSSGCAATSSWPSASTRRRNSIAAQIFRTPSPRRPSSPWLDITWRARFGEMLQRTEARLHPVDRGPIPTLFADAETLERPEAAICALQASVPGLLDDGSAPRRRLRSSPRCARRRASRSTSFPSSTVTFAVGGAATRCGRHTIPATPPIRFASSPAPSPSRASPVSTSRSVTCSIASRRRPTTNWLLPEPLRLHSRAVATRIPHPDFSTPSSPLPTSSGPRRLTQNPVRRLGDLDEWNAESADKAVHGTTGSSLTVVDSSHVLLSVPLGGRQVGRHHDHHPRVRRRRRRSGCHRSRRRRCDVRAAGSCCRTGTSDSQERQGSPQRRVDSRSHRRSRRCHRFRVCPPRSVSAARLFRTSSSEHAGLPCSPSSAQPSSTVFHVIEGMLDLVHLDHSVDFVGELPSETSILVVNAEVASVLDTDLGRVVEVKVEVGAMLGEGLDAPAVVTLTERFAIRGRTGTGELADPARAGGSISDAAVRHPASSSP